ncbi:MAG: hypothetical protein HN712_17745 [Gemmatimonadetes bacterium]|nr:hypothetical protein [Gemmatimonadota bacterium]
MMSPRVRRRGLLSIAVSVIVHLLLLSAYLHVMDWQRQRHLRPTRYLPDLLLLVPQAFRGSSSRIPTVSMEQAETPLEVEDLTQDLATLQEPGQVAPTPMPGLPASALSGIVEAGSRPLVFESIHIDLDTVDLGQSQFEAVQRLRDLYGSYAHIWLPDADTTDQQSVLENRARAIVAEALEAMGGTERLLKIHSMDVLVWLIATDHQTPIGLQNVSPYAYPMGYWHFDDEPGAQWDQTPFAIDLGQILLPPYASMNPARSRSKYYQVFEGRWILKTPPPTRKFRQRSEGMYWHVAHRFLDEGIRLAYAGRGTFAHRPVHEIVVVDSKYGRQYESYFDRQTKLLIGIREELTNFEKQWFRQARMGLRSRPPVWTTHFEDYQDVDGVLLPTRWRRSDGSTIGGPSTILLNIGLNGALPDETIPEL